jgi:hypothetical protein
MQMAGRGDVCARIRCAEKPAQNLVANSIGGMLRGQTFQAVGSTSQATSEAAAKNTAATLQSIAAPKDGLGYIKYGLLTTDCGTYL